jgi:DNA-binding NarL/FixJ family response regulator
MRIRVVVAEDDLLVREGITTLLATQGDLEIVAVSSDLDGLLEVVASERPDVVVTDIRMPPGHSDEGIRAARLLRKKYPQVGVVVLSQFDDPGYVLAVLEDGTDRRGYLLKERISDVDELAGAIRIVAAGGSVIDPKVVEALVTRQHRKSGSRLQWRGTSTPSD